MDRVCFRCRKLHGDKSIYCRPCANIYQRKWRKENPRKGEAKKRDAVRSYSNVMKKRGLLIPLLCQKCGNHESEMHHPDYELPRYVIWLCHPCHLAWHAHWRELVKQSFQTWLGDKRDQEKVA